MDLGLDVLFARFDAEQLTKIVDEFEASVVLRRWLPGGGAPVRPYLGARAGYTRLSADYETLQLEQNGGMAGLTLGAVLPTGKTLAPTVALEAMRIWYADTNIFLEGENIPQTGGSAWRLFFRVGVTFGSGWERRGR